MPGTAHNLTAAAPLNFQWLGNEAIPEGEERYLVLDIIESSLWMDTSRPGKRALSVLYWSVPGPMSGTAVDAIVRAAAARIRLMESADRAVNTPLRLKDVAFRR